MLNYFCVWREAEVEGFCFFVFFPPLGYSVTEAPPVRMTFFSPLNCLGSVDWVVLTVCLYIQAYKTLRPSSESIHLAPTCSRLYMLLVTIMK